MKLTIVYGNIDGQIMIKKKKTFKKVQITFIQKTN